MNRNISTKQLDDVASLIAQIESGEVKTLMNEPRTKKPVHRDKETLTKLNNIDFSDMNSVYPFVRKMVYGMCGHYHPNRRDPLDEVAWDCYTHFVIKKYFERYDEKQAFKTTNKMYFIKIGVRNYLIDQERKAARRIKTVSGDREIGEGTTLFNMIDDKVSDEMVARVVVEELVDTLKGRQDWGMEHETPCCGTTKVSHHAIMVHYIRGYKRKEIAAIFTLSVNRVNGIIREGLDLMIEKVERDKLELAS